MAANDGDAAGRMETALPEVFGRYRVKRKLGGGGMGTVYQVENTELQRDEALKAQKNAHAQTAMAGARELLALGRGGPASLVLVAVEDPERVRGWTEVATDILVHGIPKLTLSAPAPSVVRIGPIVSTMAAMLSSPAMAPSVAT